MHSKSLLSWLKRRNEKLKLELMESQERSAVRESDAGRKDGPGSLGDYPVLAACLLPSFASSFAPFRVSNDMHLT